jgi:hypothetical protein
LISYLESPDAGVTDASGISTNQTGVSVQDALDSKVDASNPVILNTSGVNTGDQTASTISTNATGETVQSELDTINSTILTKNIAIVGATKTKITYDSKGLVTSGTDATTADIAPSSDRNYVTDAKLVVITNTSGVNTGDQTASTVSTNATGETVQSELDTLNTLVIEAKRKAVAMSIVFGG